MAWIFDKGRVEKNMKYIILALCFCLCCCAPAKFEPFKPPMIELPPTDNYSIKETIENLPKPESLKIIWLKKEGDIYVVTERAEGTHVLLAQSEYAKVGVLLKRAIALKDIALEQEILINTYIDQLNEVKSIFTLEQQKSIDYRRLWIESENAYRQEAAQHKLDNTINRGAMYFITVGSIVVLLLAL